MEALHINHANYSDTINVLKESYECIRDTAFSHYTALIDYPKITEESPKELKRLVLTFKQHIYALNKLGESYLDTSAMISSILLSKLPASVQYQWEMTLTNNELPQYSHLLNFLQRLARSTRSITKVKQPRGSSDPTKLRERATRRHVFTTI